MAYRVSKVKRLTGPQFKIRFEWFEAGIRKSRDLRKDEWPNHGFHLAMSLEDANARKDSLNAEEHLKRHHVRRAKIAQRMEIEELAQSAFLPPVFTQEFEQRLFGRRHSKGKLPSFWKVSRRIITELKITPSEWADRKDDFYDYFSGHRFSVSYVQKLLNVLNKYGQFYSKKHKVYFEPIPYPTGVERVRILEANRKPPTEEQKRMGGNKESEPITPSMLESKRSTISKVEHYNWLFVSVWLGLRPEEIDVLKDPASYKLSSVSGASVLHVFQTKLVALDPDKRWKLIPCFLPEQEEAIRIIKSGHFKRPLSKSVAAWFGTEKVGLYGGRKGFTDLMLSKGQILEDISMWMGHTSIDRTWKSYKNKQVVRFRRTG
jgi:hypothetical protein